MNTRGTQKEGPEKEEQAKNSAAQLKKDRNLMMPKRKHALLIVNFGEIYSLTNQTNRDNLLFFINNAIDVAMAQHGLIYLDIGNLYATPEEFSRFYNGISNQLPYIKRQIWGQYLLYITRNNALTSHYCSSLTEFKQRSSELQLTHCIIGGLTYEANCCRIARQLANDTIYALSQANTWLPSLLSENPAEGPYRFDSVYIYGQLTDLHPTAQDHQYRQYFLAPTDLTTQERNQEPPSPIETTESNASAFTVIVTPPQEEKRAETTSGPTMPAMTHFSLHAGANTSESEAEITTGSTKKHKRSHLADLSFMSPHNQTIATNAPSLLIDESKKEKYLRTPPTPRGH